MDKQKTKDLRGSIYAAIKPLENEHDVVFNIGNVTYGDSSCKFKMEVLDNLSDGKGVDFMELAFKAGCHLFGLTPEDYGKSFHTNGQTFTISGLKPKSRKYPIIATCTGNGKHYKFQASRVVGKLEGLAETA